MDQFLRDYDEYCAEIEWEKELKRLSDIWVESLLKERAQEYDQLILDGQDPDQIILNLETDDDE